MKKISGILAGLPLVLSGCGGGGSGDSGGNDNTLNISDYKGTWSNDQVQTVTTASGNSVTFGASVSLATSNDRLAYMTGDFKAIIVDPATNVGHYYSAFTYVDTVSINISEVSDNLTLGFNNPEREITGSIQVQRDSNYSRSASLANLAGTWNDNYYTNYGAWTFEINPDGSFTGISMGHSCEASGNFNLIDAAANEYQVTMEITRCASSVSGSYSGIAYTDTTTVADDTLIIMTSNGTRSGSRFMGFKPEKQP